MSSISVYMGIWLLWALVVAHINAVHAVPIPPHTAYCAEEEALAMMYMDQQRLSGFRNTNIPTIMRVLGRTQGSVIRKLRSLRDRLHPSDAPVPDMHELDAGEEDGREEMDVSGQAENEPESPARSPPPMRLSSMPDRVAEDSHPSAADSSLAQNNLGRDADDVERMYTWPPVTTWPPASIGAHRAAKSLQSTSAANDLDFVDFMHAFD
jgi:hypothetical protein